jgi:hypothetical protein
LPSATTTINGDQLPPPPAKFGAFELERSWKVFSELSPVPCSS